MKISYNWLKKYIDTHLDIKEVSDLLTFSGLEVEDITSYESLEGGLKQVVIGEVIEKEKHPEADKLSITKVNVGHEILQIVCGAPNVESGQIVVVALVGANLTFADGHSEIYKWLEPMTGKHSWDAPAQRPVDRDFDRLAATVATKK